MLKKVLKIADTRTRQLAYVALVRPISEYACPVRNPYFSKVTPVGQYKLGTTCIAWAENTKYFGVTIQSDLTFDLHIAEKSIKSNKILAESNTPCSMLPKKLIC